MVARDRVDQTGPLFADFEKRLRRLEAGAPIGYSSVSEGRLRIASNEGLLVQGSEKVEGFLIVTGTERVTGLLEVLGTFTVSGDASITGPFTIAGATDITGAVNITGPLTIDGLTTLLKTLTVTSPGKIVVAGGPSALTLQSGEMSFASGGKIDGTSGLRAYVSGGGFLSLQSGIAQLSRGAKSITIDSVQTTVTGGLQVDNLSTTGSKLFSMPHPSKPGHSIQHGSTESPVSGIEYWGDEELGADGAAVVELPDYFEALAKPEGRTVFITGRGFSPDWTDVDDGKFVVTGTPGARFSWLVKAVRFGGDFDVEPEVPTPDESTG